MHLEQVSDLISHAFVAALRRLIAGHGKPKVISDHSTNTIGRKNDLKKLELFLRQGVKSH